jgi:hypothetical protein
MKQSNSKILICTVPITVQQQNSPYKPAGRDIALLTTNREQNLGIQARPLLNMTCIISRVTSCNPHIQKVIAKFAPLKPHWVSPRSNAAYIPKFHRAISTGMNLCRFHLHGHVWHLRTARYSLWAATGLAEVKCEMPLRNLPIHSHQDGIYST